MTAAVKLAHLTCASVSLCGFMLRGWWMLTAPELLSRPLVRVLPHGVDAVLLGTGIWLAVAWQRAGLPLDWLWPKLGAVLLYIVLGMVALGRGRSRPVRALAFSAALLVFGGIVYLALAKPLPGS